MSSKVQLWWWSTLHPLQDVSNDLSCAVLMDCLACATAAAPPQPPAKGTGTIDHEVCKLGRAVQVHAPHSVPHTTCSLAATATKLSMLKVRAQATALHGMQA